MHFKRNKWSTHFKYPHCPRNALRRVILLQLVCLWNYEGVCEWPPWSRCRVPGRRRPNHKLYYWCTIRTRRSSFSSGPGSCWKHHWFVADHLNGPAIDRPPMSSCWRICNSNAFNYSKSIDKFALGGCGWFFWGGSGARKYILHKGSWHYNL